MYKLYVHSALSCRYARLGNDFSCISISSSLPPSPPSHAEIELVTFLAPSKAQGKTFTARTSPSTWKELIGQAPHSISQGEIHSPPSISYLLISQQTLPKNKLVPLIGEFCGEGGRRGSKKCHGQSTDRPLLVKGLRHEWMLFPAGTGHVVDSLSLLMMIQKN